MKRYRIYFLRQYDGFMGRLPGVYFSRGFAVVKARKLTKRHHDVIYYVRPL